MEKTKRVALVVALAAGTVFLPMAAWRVICLVFLGFALIRAAFPEARIALWAMALRIVLWLWIWGVGLPAGWLPPYAFGDVVGDYMTTARMLQRGEPPPTLSPAHLMFARIYSVVGRIAGEDRFAPALVLSVWPSVCVVALLEYLARRAGRPGMGAAAWLLCLWPTQIFWGASGLRDPMIMLALFLCFLGCLSRFPFLGRGGLAAIGAGVLYFLRPEMLAVPVLAAGIALIRRLVQILFRRPRGMRTAAAWALCAVVAIAGADRFRSLVESLPARLSGRFSRVVFPAQIRSRLLPEITMETPGQIVWQGPAVVFAALFAPLPGLDPSAHRISHFAAMAQNLLFLALVLCSAYVGWKRRDRIPPEIRWAWIFFLAALPTLLIASDQGAAMRYKSVLEPLFFLAASPALAELSGGPTDPES